MFDTEEYKLSFLFVYVHIERKFLGAGACFKSPILATVQLAPNVEPSLAADTTVFAKGK